jgi:hypothetical protein
MKHLKLALTASCLLIVAFAAQAQEKKMEAKADAKKMEMPKPAPEVKNLGYFVGDWTSEGNLKPGPWGAGGKMTGASHCAWMPGNYFVVCNETDSGAMGNMHGLGVLGYDPATKMYTYNGFNSMGENEHAAGTRDGNTWTYTNESMMGGKMMKGRYTMTETSPTGYEYKLETSEDGKTWTSMMEGKVTKKAAPEKKM